MREEKTGNVRLVTKRDCWELISQNKDTRKKGNDTAAYCLMKQGSLFRF